MPTRTPTHLGGGNWWYSPYYYFPLTQNIDEDPCDCFGKYKNAMDSGVIKTEAQKILTACVEKTVRGGAC